MRRYQSKKLIEILDSETRNELSRQFEETEAALEFEPLPRGDYDVNVVHGEVCVSERNTPGYTVALEVNDGPYCGRRIWHTFWLSEAALRYSKRDMAKLGITKLEQCEQPVPPGLFCRVSVVVRMDDRGLQRNSVTRITAGGVRKDATVDPDFGVPTPPELNGGAV